MSISQRITNWIFFRSRPDGSPSPSGFCLGLAFVGICLACAFPVAWAANSTFGRDPNSTPFRHSGGSQAVIGLVSVGGVVIVVLAVYIWAKDRVAARRRKRS
jgi:hypothetical protein